MCRGHYIGRYRYVYICTQQVLVRRYTVVFLWRNELLWWSLMGLWTSPIPYTASIGVVQVYWWTMDTAQLISSLMPACLIATAKAPPKIWSLIRGGRAGFSLCLLVGGLGGGSHLLRLNNTYHCTARTLSIQGVPACIHIFIIILSVTLLFTYIRILLIQQLCHNNNNNSNNHHRDTLRVTLSPPLCYNLSICPHTSLS